MTPEQRTKRLRKLMARHKLGAADVGEMLNRSAQTVRSWACKYPLRAIPEHTLTVLETKLAEKVAP